MIKLKTLKDYTPITGVSNPAMEFAMNRAVDKFKEDLIAEAIKWVKRLKRECQTQCSCGGWCEVGHISQIEWIQYFFNISDEELK